MPMAGIVYIIIASVIYPIVDVFKKKATASYPVKVIFWGVATFSLPVYAAMLFINGIPEIDPSFWLLIAINTPLLIYTNILLIKNEKIAPISTTLPLLSFTPVFLIFTSYVFLGELPNQYGIIGIFLIVLGALMLKGESLRHHLGHQLRGLLMRKESQIILIIAFIWSFNANLVKMASLASSVWLYLFITVLLEAIIMNIWMGYKHRRHLKKVIKGDGHIIFIILAALITAVADAAFLYGLEQTLVAYAIAIRRAFLIIGSLALGAFIFHEKNIKYRIGGAFIMIVGITLILLLR